MLQCVVGIGQPAAPEDIDHPIACVELDAPCQRRRIVIGHGPGGIDPKSPLWPVIRRQARHLVGSDQDFLVHRDIPIQPCAGRGDVFSLLPGMGEFERVRQPHQTDPPASFTERWRTVAIAGLIAIISIADEMYLADPGRKREDTYAAKRWLESNVPADEEILITSNEMETLATFHWPQYRFRLNPAPGTVATPNKAVRLATELPFPVNSDHVVYVFGRAWLSDPDGLLRAELKRQYEYAAASRCAVSAFFVLHEQLRHPLSDFWPATHQSADRWAETTSTTPCFERIERCPCHSMSRPTRSFRAGSL